MQPSLEKIDLQQERSLLIRHISLPYFNAPYHFHPEYELTYILRGSGQRFVGDSVERFSEGDWILLGPNLPHFWQSDEVFYEPHSSKRCEALVVQFSSVLLDKTIRALPEFSTVATFLDQAGRGISFDANPRHLSPEAELLPLLTDTPTEQILRVLQLLCRLSAQPTHRFLTAAAYSTQPNTTETERMARILTHSMQHFRRPLALSEIAEVAHLSEAAFCRYFRQRTHKTFVTYLTELRISHARQLLRRSELSVSQVALESGFQNAAHFHRVFLRLTQQSPLQFRQAFISSKKR
ncbi:helix-turn-helix domain-containing protein [Arundinibacter roseus]|uniref:AraC family transcriptional regulator n=1 Tax=Arundinibacter roseus TaxID=2070510 RepID=A0A4R4KB28_9BACT|nr:AraC family transcriptional regulator [Arundinibacter roseus]TDB63369.1 AraC family transcriptional regulator [Arundinibacter roseus]